METKIIIALYRNKITKHTKYYNVFHYHHSGVFQEHLAINWVEGAAMRLGITIGKNEHSTNTVDLYN